MQASRARRAGHRSSTPSSPTFWRCGSPSPSSRACRSPPHPLRRAGGQRASSWPPCRLGRFAEAWSFGWHVVPPARQDHQSIVVASGRGLDRRMCPGFALLPAAPWAAEKVASRFPGSPRLGPGSCSEHSGCASPHPGRSPQQSSIFCHRSRTEPLGGAAAHFDPALAQYSSFFDGDQPSWNTVAAARRSRRWQMRRGNARPAARPIAHRHVPARPALCGRCRSRFAPGIAHF